MRTPTGAAGLIVAALYLTACDADNTGPGPDAGGGRSEPAALTATPAQLVFRIYAFDPERDPPAQILQVDDGGTLDWTADEEGVFRVVWQAQVGDAIFLDYAAVVSSVYDAGNDYHALTLRAEKAIFEAGDNDDAGAADVTLAVSVETVAETNDTLRLTVTNNTGGSEDVLVQMATQLSRRTA